MIHMLGNRNREKQHGGMSADLFTKIGCKVNYYEIIYMKANNIQLLLILKSIQYFTREVQYSLSTKDVIKY